jgi:hypothetical protein
MKKSLFILLLISTSINAFSQVKFREGVLWGFKDKKTNTVLIKPKFGYAEDFKDGYAVVSEQAATPNARKKMKAINIKGAYLNDTAYEYLNNLGQGVFAFSYKLNSSFGILDKNGKVIIQPELNYAPSISEGLMVLSKGSQNGAIDLKGNFVIPYNDYAMSDFKCGVSVVSKGGYQKGLMGKTGAIVYAPDSSGIVTIGNFNKSCVAEFRKKDNRYGLISSTGKILVEPIYTRTSGLSDNGVTYYKDGVQFSFTGTGQKK